MLLNIQLTLYLHSQDGKALGVYLGGNFREYFVHKAGTIARIKKKHFFEEKWCENADYVDSGVINV